MATDVREAVAHMLILCNYVLDANALTDIEVLKAKAQQVKRLLTDDEG